MLSGATFWVRDIPVHGDVILAPMAGFADVPHRAICRSFGSAMNYTEFVAVEELINGSKRAISLLDHGPDEHPLVFQIFGNSAQLILRAAQQIEELGPDIIDINMGCSTRRVSGRGAGVGMMPHVELIAETFSLLTKHLSVPVTGKIRLGWDEQQNYLEVARVMEENGASLIAIHPRTKEQKYSGMARWDAIARVKESVSVPVIGNGDVREPSDIDRMLAETGCDAVMIGRGAIGNPWIFDRRSRDSLFFSEVIHTIQDHLEAMLSYHDSYGLILFRKHLKRYLGHIPALSKFYEAMIIEKGVQAFLILLSEAELCYGDLPMKALVSLAPAPETEVTLLQALA